jgi:hypothetical protein
MTCKPENKEGKVLDVIFRAIVNGEANSAVHYLDGKDPANIEKLIAATPAKLLEYENSLQISEKDLYHLIADISGVYGLVQEPVDPTQALTAAKSIAIRISEGLALKKV